MKRMVIKGSEWHRGGSKKMRHGARLLTDKGKLCCLGIHARLCGVPDSVLLDECEPDDLSWNEIPDCYLPWVDGDSDEDMIPSNNALADEAVVINDKTLMSDRSRIAALRPIFHEIGVSIVWRPEL